MGFHFCLKYPEPETQTKNFNSQKIKKYIKLRTTTQNHFNYRPAL
jgi:hypothetical protein